MSGYKGHLAGGLVAYGLVLSAAQVLQMLNPSPLTAAEWLGFTLAGALFPDIDIKSKGQKYFYSVLFILFIILIGTHHIELVAILGLLAVIPMMVRHRGIFHRTWFVIVLPVACALVCSTYSTVDCTILLHDAFFFILGALSHLVLDLGVRRTLRGK